MHSLVRSVEPLLELDVEVLRRVGRTAGQKRGLEIAIGSLDQAFGLRVGGPALDHPNTEAAGERAHRLGQLWLAGRPLPDRGLVVPDQRFRDGSEPPQQGPMSVQQVTGLPGRDHRRRQPARIAADHHPHRRPAGLAEPPRNIRRREPQIALRELTRLILGALRRIRRHEQRPQRPHPVLEHRHRPLPADSFSDHRLRHRRSLRQQHRCPMPTPDAPCCAPPRACGRSP